MDINKIQKKVAEYQDLVDFVSAGKAEGGAQLQVVVLGLEHKAVMHQNTFENVWPSIEKILNARMLELKTDLEE